METINNLSTLKINLLTKEQYDREKAAGNIASDQLYIQDLSSSASINYVDQSISDLADATLEAIPTKTSELTNDSGFLTSHQSLANYVTLNGTQTITGIKTFNATLTAAAGLNVTGNVSATGTITGSKVYNAVWNDYAEWFEKDNLEEEFNPGDICIWTGKGATKSKKLKDKACIGIVSDSYGHILGGEKLFNMENNHKKYVPIGLKGRIKCNIIGPVEIGDLIVTSEIEGTGIVDNDARSNLIIGKALETNLEEGKKQIIVLV